MGTIPFWACLSANLAGSNSRRFNRTFAFADHSCLLGASPLSASSLTPFRPCTPTFGNQSPAVGQCCLPSTWGVGVDQLVAGRTYMGTQLSKSRLITQGVHLRYLVNSAAFPPAFSSRFRANRSHQRQVRPAILIMTLAWCVAHQK
jgi:hypothetical protein